MFSEWPLLKNNPWLGSVIQMLKREPLPGASDIGAAPTSQKGPEGREEKTRGGPVSADASLLPSRAQHRQALVPPS